MDIQRIRPYHVKRKNGIEVEDAIRYKTIEPWHCDKGHVFYAPPYAMEYIIDNKMCPCCRTLEGKEIDYAATDNPYEVPDSLYNLDIEMLDGVINKMFVPDDTNFINEIKATSNRIIQIREDEKVEHIKAKELTKRLTLQLQDKLRKIYFEHPYPVYKGFFSICRCSSCGLFVPCCYEDKNPSQIADIKCVVCNNTVVNPNSFGYWLDKNRRVGKILERGMTNTDYERIRKLDRNNEIEEIGYFDQFHNYVVSTAFCISHEIHYYPPIKNIYSIK